MLSYFPTPYPDEIFYSLIARYFLHLGCSNQPIKVFSALFGKEYSKAILSFPRNLSYFHQQVGANLKSSLDQIINNYTLFPLYSPYITASRKQLFYKSMTNSSGNFNYFLITGQGNHSSLKRPRYCPYCFEEGLTTFGEAYWHRSHQIPTLFFCTTHSCYLSTIAIKPETLNPSFYIPPVKEYCPEVASPQLDNPEAMEVAKRLLLAFHENYRIEINPDLYRSILLKSSFGKGENTIDLLAFYDAFSAFYSKETLQLFFSSVSLSEDFCWLKTAIRNSERTIDPIRHALLQGFLSSISETKIETSNALQKYPCRNLICSFYEKLKGDFLEEHYDSKSKKIIKTICCSNCGYTYTKSNKKQANEYNFTVKDFGSLWKEKLYNLYQQGLSLKKMARSLSDLKFDFSEF
jgi:transposase-like protein